MVRVVKILGFVCALSCTDTLPVGASGTRG